MTKIQLFAPKTEFSILSTENMQTLDSESKKLYASQNAGTSAIQAGYQLMKQAGHALFEFIKARLATPVAVFVGAGNNGGDGLVLAKHLTDAGIPCTVYGVCDPAKYKNEAQMAYEDFTLAGGKIIPFYKDAPLKQFKLIVDCVLGLGARGELRPEYEKAVIAINQSKVPVIAADVPTGYDSFLHILNVPHINAQETLLFGYPRLDAYTIEGGAAFGKVSVAALDFPEELVQKFSDNTFLANEQIIPELLPPRNEWGDKRKQGCALIIAGSKDMPGAAVLCTKAALRSGTGLVTLASPASATPSLQAKLTEPVFVSLPDSSDGTVQPGNLPILLYKAAQNQAIAIGPGLSCTPAAKEFVLEFLSRIDDQPVVIDADALNSIASEPSILKNIKTPAILTPHTREYERLFGKLPENSSDIPAVLRATAKNTNKVILLKGVPTYIASPDGRIFVVPTANSGLAKGGSGDILTGIIVALLAQGLPTTEAAILGALLHQKAGRITRETMGAYSMLPSDVIRNLYKAFS